MPWKETCVMDEKDEVHWPPAISTVHCILERHGLVNSRKGRGWNEDALQPQSQWGNSPDERSEEGCLAEQNPSFFS